jgi:hypothetical protein
VARAEVRIPRLELSTDDGNSSIRFRLGVQVLWTYRYEDQGSGKPAEDSNEILFRRIRPELTGSIGSRNFTYRLHLNLVPGALELMDLYVNYRAHEQFEIMFGQEKIPYTRYRLGSWQNRPMVDWDPTTRYFGAERQIGIIFHNNQSAPPRIEYQFGIFTGVNARASHGIGLPLVYADPRPNPSNLVDPAAPSSFHPELVAHLAYNHGGIDVAAPQDWAGGPARFSIGLSAAWDIRPADMQDLALRLAPEAILKLYGFTLWGVAHLGFSNEMADDDNVQLGLIGAMVQASVVFCERYEIALRYGHVTIMSDLRDDARAYRDQQIADAADDPELQEELTTQFRSVGRLQAEHELLLGFNVYFLDTALKLQLDGGMLVHERTDGDRYDMRIRTQLQLVF